jgi:hypothetical protein
VPTHFTVILSTHAMPTSSAAEAKNEYCSLYKDRLPFMRQGKESAEQS